MPVLELNNISKSYDQKSLVVQNISFSLERDDFLVLLGPSGCGKSTILNMIAGLESVTSEDIFLNGVRINDLSSQNRNIAMVFQNYALYPNMTVWDNIAFPLKNRHMKKSEIINTGLLNTYFAVIITSMSIPFLVFLFRQNTKLIPIDIIKSARMDGAYELNIFFRIYVPCMKNVYVAALLISFINAWTSVIFPMILLQSQDRFTFAIFLDSLGSLWYADYAVLMLALLVSSLPILIVYFIFQRQIKSLIGGFGL